MARAIRRRMSPMTAKIALAHLHEFPDYYTRLDTMETEAEKKWAAEDE
jgi:hypothetical protein